jgi:NAD(P)-dependent dehydrogenase (short-subunit alcohol dehydrogenase family)
VLTGAAAGIGEATARRLVSEGARVALLDRDEPGLARVTADLGSRTAAFVADVTDAAAVDTAIAAVIERFDGIDVVVANAGIGGTVETFRTMSAESFERVIDVNVFGVARTVRAALPSIIERNGYVLVVASAAAALPTPGFAPYGVSKAGVESFGRSLRIELTETGATAGVAYFGAIDTNMLREGLLNGPGMDAFVATLPKQFGEAVPADHAARAIVDGIKRRGRWIAAPGFIYALIALRTTAALAEPLITRSPELRAAIRQADTRRTPRRPSDAPATSEAVRQWRTAETRPTMTPDRDVGVREVSFEDP